MGEDKHLSWPAARMALRELLIHQFDRDDARRILDEAGVDHTDFVIDSGTMRNVWYGIVFKSERTKQLAQIVARAGEVVPVEKAKFDAALKDLNAAAAAHRANAGADDQMADYGLDIFVSYFESKRCQDWMEKIFMPQLERRLEDSIPDASVSWNRRKQNREESLQNLRGAKCMIAVLSKSYFETDQCVIEWNTFRDREFAVGNTRLIYPVRYHDGKAYPADASQLLTELHDFSGLVVDTPSELGIARKKKLGKKLDTLIERLTQMIESSPNFDPDWSLTDVQAPAETSESWDISL